MRGLVVAASVLLSTTVALADTAQARLQEVSTVFQEIMSTPDKGIPQDLLEKAQCVIIVPDMKKAAFIVGGEYGRGFAICRNAKGTGWGAPAAVRMEGGSVGFQIGGESADVVMLVMNRKGMDKLLESKFTLGAGASLAAGPVGRRADAKTDAQLDAEILAWSRSKGLFAGISLSGATLRQDEDENKELYGKKLTNREILTGNMPTPFVAWSLVSQLERYSAHASDADRVKK
jgi:lipid-binding SYLF domain-containing protein